MKFGWLRALVDDLLAIRRRGNEHKGRISMIILSISLDVHSDGLWPFFNTVSLMAGI